MFDHKVKLEYSEEAVSETIGYSLILAIVLIAVGILVVIAFPIQSNIQDTAFVESQIQALTMLDGRISSVALGSSPSQLTRINLNGGTMNVRNYSNNFLNITVSDERTGEYEIVFENSIGLIEYKLGDNKLIYENGGMFRIYPNGESVMLSPPEFYYNGETLTFPVIRIQNSASVGGKGTISVMARSGEEKKIIYPNLSSNFLMNPITGKKITIRLKTENYNAWARYIKERTDASPNIVRNITDNTTEVVVAFNSKPSEGSVELDVPIEVYGLDTTNTTPLKAFSFDLIGVTSSFHMILHAPEVDSNVFVLELEKKCGGGTSGVYTTIKYNKDSFNETWEACVDMIFNETMTIDLLNSSYNIQYKSSTPSGSWFDEPPPDNITYNEGNWSSLDKVIQHYMRKITEDTGTFTISPDTPPPAWPKGFNDTGSKYTLDYYIMPPNINYLHIVDHAVNVTLS